MYYIILFIGVLSLLALAAWVESSRRPKTAGGFAGQGEGRSDRPLDSAGSFVAQLLKGERKEDKPCITPIDCVQAKRCAGHCGCR